MPDLKKDFLHLASSAVLLKLSLYRKALFFSSTIFAHAGFRNAGSVTLLFDKSMSCNVIAGFSKQDEFFLIFPEGSFECWNQEGNRVVAQADVLLQIFGN